MNKTVLIVDDDPNSLALLAYSLELEGYQVRQAEDGGQALATIEASPPDVVILDVMLPDISGLEVCRRIRSEMHLEELKVIMLSAISEVADQDQGMQSGANQYLGKPADPDVVIKAIRQMLG